MADFEKALWRAVDNVLNVPVDGCAYHWAKAVWTKIQNLGLKVSVIDKKLKNIFDRLSFFCK